MTFYRTGDNNFGTCKIIVDKTPGLGTHSTITAALADAVAGDDIFIRASSTAYTENLTLKTDVNLCAFTCDSGSYTDAGASNVTISGTLSATFIGNCVISGIRLQTNSAACLSVTGTNPTNVLLLNCMVNATSATAIVMSTNTGAQVECQSCTGNLGSTFGFFALSSGSNRLLIDNSAFLNNSGTTTASTMSGTSSLVVRNSTFQNAVTTSNTAGVLFQNSVIAGALVLNATGGGDTIQNCVISAGSASGISIGAGATAAVEQSTINSSNTNAITGAGTLNYFGLSFDGSSSSINTTTKVQLSSGLPLSIPNGGTGSTTFPGFTVAGAQTFIATGTYTPTASMKYCIVEVVGGGGGGGGAVGAGGSNSSGAGGGAGGYAKAIYTAAQIGVSKTVTIGAGGAGGSAGLNAGTGGGTSSMSTLISATGGGGGNPSNSGINIPGLGGAGGVGTVGSGTSVVATYGQTGGAGLTFGTLSYPPSGAGGSSMYGAGGGPCINNGASNPGLGYGAGGGGGSANASSGAGAAGTDGVIIVTEFI